MTTITTTDAALGMVILLQLVTIVLLARRKDGGAAKPEEKPKPTKEENRAEEVAKLKAVLSSPEQMAAYALAGFKGDSKKAKESVQKRLQKLTGEWIEAPFQ